MKESVSDRKIVFVNRFYWPDHSATSQILTDLAIFLAARGHSVSVICSRQRYDDPSAALATRETRDGVDIYRAGTTEFGRGSFLGRILDYLSFYVSSAVLLWRIVRRGDVVIAKTDPPLVSVPVSGVARIRGARTVNWLQDVFPEVAAVLGVRLARGIAGKLISAIRDRALRTASANVVLGERMAGMVSASAGAGGRVVAIANWTDDRAIAPVKKADNILLAEWGLEGKFVVGYSGNLGRAHEFQTILGAAEALRLEEGIVFLFIGAGAQLDPVKSAVVERGLRNVVFKPYQPREKLAQSLGVADLHFVALQPDLEGLIVPSKFYGIAAAGRPVAFIGDKDGEIARVITRYNCGATFGVGEAESLAAFIRKLARNPDESERLGLNARRSIDREYSQDNAFRKWEELLNSV